MLAGDGTLPEISVIRKRTKMPSDAFNFSLFATGVCGEILTAVSLLVLLL